MLLRLRTIKLYSGGSDQKDRSSKSDQANNSTRPYLEKSFTKNRPGAVTQDEGSEFKPQY
jgi:hypothetical protein